MQNEFSRAYALARELVIKGDAVGASRLLERCSQILNKVYSSTQSVQDRAKCRALASQLSHISCVLATRGITKEVCQLFNLPFAPRPSQARPRAEHGEEQSWSEAVYAKSLRGVVTVCVPDGNGTGFIISDKGYLLTNHHVIKAQRGLQRSISMSFKDEHRSYPLTAVDADSGLDVALCSFDAGSVRDFCSLPIIKDYSTLKQGASVVLIGNPVSQGIAPFTGTVSYTKNDYEDLVFSAPSNPGCSGGPVLDKNGYVVGINKSLTVSVNGIKTQGLTNATPASKISELLDKWQARHKIRLW